MAAKVAGAVTAGVATWRAVAAIDGRVLVIVNSLEEGEVSTLFDAIERCVPSDRLHVIATRGWQGWLRDRGWSGDRVLFSTDETGQDLELNFFLERPVAVRWIVERRFSAIVGTAPHNLYNEEVKDLFERRLGVFLGASHFLAHTLPGPYVFVLDLAALLRRLDRGRKAAEYDVLARALVVDLHREWTERGAPGVSDAWPFDDAATILERRLGAAILSWDEAVPIPWTQPGFPVVEAFVSYAERVLHHAVVSRDAQVPDLEVADLQRAKIAGLQGEVTRRDELLRTQEEELTSEIQARDRRLADLHDELSQQVASRDHRLRDLQDTLAREVADRDRQLAEMREAFTREVKVRDQNLIDMYAERTMAVDTRDAIIDELRAQLKKRR